MEEQKMLSARPAGLTYEKYRFLLAEQKLKLKNYKKGTPRWLPRGWAEYTATGVFIKWIIEPMGTYRRGMEMLSV